MLTTHDVLSSLILRNHNPGANLSINALIRSIFDYCSPVYVKLPNKLCKKVKKVEKRAHRLIYGEDASCSCILDGMIRGREELSVRLYFKILHDKHHLLHNKLPHILPHNTRLSNFTCRTNKRLHSYFPYTTQLINTKKFTLPTNSVWVFLLCAIRIACPLSAL